MTSFKELEDNMLRMKSIDFSNMAEEFAYYKTSGMDKQNALEYEKAYIALIEQVKDKSHEEQVHFLMEHMNELRNMVALFSSTDDFYHFKDNEQDKEILANVLIYRYENNISVLDDRDCCLTKDIMFAAMRRTSDRKVAEELAARRKFQEEHPEEYRRQQEEKLRDCQQLAEDLRELNKKVQKSPYFQKLLELSK